ncbi:MAG: dehydrogenase [Rhodobacteraceae bacterium]|nr:MAG: dehydrogenase [Paracoccaceae bacterium]
MTARALWITAPRQVEIRPAQTGAGVLVEAVYSGISRGTEALVFAGEVPVSEAQRMRGPGMEGAFDFPVKYGYCSVGRVMEGALAGKLVFALFPHQTQYRLPEASLTVLPEGLPAGRAVLGANMETALNIVWDSGAQAGDRIAVIGAGVVGLLTAGLLAQLPGAEVTLVDIQPQRAGLAATLGLRCVLPEAAPRDCDVVIHTSASASGLGCALTLAGLNATVVEASWYGTRSVPVALGAGFHSQRLRLISSQVGHLPSDRAPRWSYARRMATALTLLCADARLDALISGETYFEDLPAQYPEILAAPETICHRIRYT